MLNQLEEAVIKVPTKEGCETFVNYLKDQNFAFNWNNRDTNTTDIWDKHKDQTCIHLSVNEANYCNKGFYTNQGFNLISIETYMERTENKEVTV